MRSINEYLVSKAKHAYMGFPQEAALEHIIEFLENHGFKKANIDENAHNAGIARFIDASKKSKTPIYYYKKCEGDARKKNNYWILFADKGEICKLNPAFNCTLMPYKYIGDNIVEEQRVFYSAYDFEVIGTYKEFVDEVNRYFEWK